MMNALKLMQLVAALQLVASSLQVRQLFLFQPVHVLIVPDGTAQFQDDSVV